MKNIGVLIYTYNRTDDAMISMEFIRRIWQPSFPGLKIVHSYNGLKSWYPKKYLEDELVRSRNSWHFQGAADLIDAGMAVFKRKFSEVEYVVVLAADTWLVKAAYLETVLSRLKKGKMPLATSVWGLPGQLDPAELGVATDFFVVDAKWSRKNKMFPLNYRAFFKKYADLFLYQGRNVMLERLALARYYQAISQQDNFGGIARKTALEKLLLMTERHPVHSQVDKQGMWIRNMYWPKIGLLTHHNPAQKKAILKHLRFKLGPQAAKLLSAKDLSYYNQGQTKMPHNCN